MKDKGIVDIDAVVVKVLPNQMFKVQLIENDHEVLCYASGKIKQNKIKIVEDDRVKIEVSTHDLSRGRIVYRY